MKDRYYEAHFANILQPGNGGHVSQWAPVQTFVNFLCNLNTVIEQAVRACPGASKHKAYFGMRAHKHKKKGEFNVFAERTVKMLIKYFDYA